MYRVALIGCGAISKVHAEYLCQMPEIELVGLCDVRPERAKELAAAHSLDVPVFTDYREMLDTLRPDSVHICTPHYLHVPMAVCALERNINVLSEKPVCIDPDQMKALLKTAKESRAKICVSFQNRFLDRNIRLKQILESGEYGKVKSVFGNVLWKRTKEYYAESGWRGSFATEGGSVMINQALHTLDLILWYCGDPETVAGVTTNFHLRGVIETEDTAVARMTYPGDMTALFFATTANSVSAPVGLEFRCEKGVLALRDGDLWIDGVAQNLKDPVAPTGKSVWGIGHQNLFRAFYGSLKEGTPAPVAIEDAYRSIRVLRAVYESEGRPLVLAERE